MSEIDPVARLPVDLWHTTGLLENRARLRYNARPVGSGMFLEQQEIYPPVHVGVPIPMGQLTGGRT